MESSCNLSIGRVTVGRVTVARGHDRRVGLAPQRHICASIDSRLWPARMPPRRSYGTIARLARQTVLIVDDHAAFRLATTALLEAEGFRVVGEAASGEEAIRAVALLRPDVVLLDIQLPRG